MKKTRARVETGRKQGQRGPRKVAASRRIKLVQFIEKYGWGNWDAQAWAEQHGISIPSSYDDRAAVLKQGYVVDKDKYLFELTTGVDRVLSTARARLQDPKLSERDRKGWAIVYLQAIERATGILEAYGIKPKAVTPITVNGQLTAEDFARAYEQTEEKP